MKIEGGGGGGGGLERGEDGKGMGRELKMEMGR